LIDVHSQKSKVAFEAARNVDVGIELFPQGFIPPEGCVVLTASRWTACAGPWSWPSPVAC
jgi:hypothetical protein